jgi:hypothetical protein
MKILNGHCSGRKLFGVHLWLYLVVFCSLELCCLVAVLLCGVGVVVS